MGIELKVGEEYLHKGGRVTLVTVADSTVFLRPNGSTHIYPAEVSDLAPVPTAEELLHPTMSFDGQSWERANQLAEAITLGLSQNTAMTDLVSAIAENFKVSQRQAHRYIAKFRQDSSPLALIPEKPGPKIGLRRVEREREVIIANAIESEYLRREKPSFEHLYECISTECRSSGVKPPCKNTVRKRIKSITAELRTRRREGAKRAKEKHGAAPGYAPADYPLHRVEIDHTLCDVILVADTPAREVLGRPWLTLAIDVFTRMVVGLYLSYERPSSASVAMCLANAILPKDAWLANNGVAGEWPCQGRMEEIWVDNAMEFRAVALRRGCDQFQTKLQYRPVGSPEIGASIERLIGTMMGRVHLIPGTTQSNTVKKADYDAQASACMTLREFTTWLTEQIVTKYHLGHHKGINKMPLTAWNEYFGEKGPAFKGTHLEVLGAFLPAVGRKLRRIGVEFKAGHYWSERFTPWIGEDRDVVVHYHPLDASVVYVRLPSGELAVAECSSRTSRKGLTFDDVRRRGSLERAPARDPRVIQKRDESHNRALALLKESQEKTAAARENPPQQHKQQEFVPAAQIPSPRVAKTLAVRLN